jgi:hypothetical protein
MLKFVIKLSVNISLVTLLGIGIAFANTTHFPYPTTLQILNETGKDIPVKIIVYGHSKMESAPNPILPGKNIYKNIDDNIEDDSVRFDLLIGDENNIDGQCYTRSFILFGSTVTKESDGSNGFQCYMVSQSGKDIFVDIRPVNKYSD